MAAVIVGVTVPILVGLSRIALGVHYPSDVLGGWLAGIAFVAFGAALIQVTDALGPPARPRGQPDRGLRRRQPGAGAPARAAGACSAGPPRARA